MIIDVNRKPKEDKPKPSWYLTDEQIHIINMRECKDTEEVSALEHLKSIKEIEHNFLKEKESVK